MKNFILVILAILTVSSCNFLETPPTSGLTEDKLTDIISMEALVTGGYVSYNNVFSGNSIIDMMISREMIARNSPWLNNFFTHEYSSEIGFNQAYHTLGLLNRVAIADLDNMKGTKEQKEAILADMLLLRAWIYFDLNNHYVLPKTGYSVPLVLAPIKVGDKVIVSKASDVRNQIETDLETALKYLKNGNKGNFATYDIVKAIAARVYFHHGNYAKAYQYADEIIKTEKYELETNLKNIFPATGTISKEVIWLLPYSSADNISPVGNLPENLLADDAKGSIYVNEHSELLKLMNTNDERYKAFFTKIGVFTYINGKFHTDKQDYPVIRLAELYLTRAEANVMVNGIVSQQDVDDLNKIIKRGMPKNVLSTIPSKESFLNTIFEERTKELCIESGDYLRNIVRTHRPMVNRRGDGIETYDQYCNVIPAMFPVNEEGFHDLNRER